MKKEITLDARKALLSTRVIPRKTKNSDPTKSDAIPFYYDGDAFASRLEVPWLECEKRVMTPAEGISLLATELDEKGKELSTLQRKFKAIAELHARAAAVLNGGELEP